MTTRTKTWQVQEAKAEFSALIVAAEKSGAQTITKRGRAVAVLLSQKEYARLLRRPKTSLVSFFERSPLGNVDLERDRSDFGRDVDF